MLPSLVLLPRAVPGEAFPSLVKRIGELSGFGTDRALMTAMQAYAQRDLRALPKFLPQFCAAVDNAYGEPFEVLNTFSLFPYYGGVLTEDAYHRLVARLLSARPGPGRPTRLPVLTSTSPFVEPNCVECAMESVSHYGAVVVLRAHLPAFVTHCPHHHLPLTSGTGPSTYDVTMLNHARVANAIEFSVRSSGLLQGNLAPGERIARLRTRIEDGGLRTKSGRYRVRAIVDGMKRVFEEGFPDSRLEELVSSGQAAAHSVAVLGRPGRELHPVYYILLDWLLDCSIARQTRRESNPRRAPLSKAILQQELEAGKTACQIAKENKLSVTTVCLYADKYSVPRATKPRRVTQSVRRSVISMLEAHQSIADVAKLTELSVSSVRRICWAAGVRLCTCADPDSARLKRDANRQRWLNECSHRPDWGRTAIRQRFPALWGWLYKHDRGWLDGHSPQRRHPRHVAWRAASLTIPSEIHASALAAVSALDCNPTRPLRRSVCRMSEAMGLTPTPFKVLSHRSAVFFRSP
ncbi:TnsD family Tn7-like transposition protein [Ralstonia pseudosolanacearum]|uniref:TnsD family Tn7-like transposition protein n=1 Tax=Ralstonia pseudosolanacearum TaxID=1310165 RepID=UPI00399D606C